MTTSAPPYRAVLWCVPALLTLHNIEEALGMPSWVPAHLALLRERAMVPFALSFSGPQLLLSIVLATLLPWGVTVWGLYSRHVSLGTYAIHLIQAIVFLNAVVPHVVLLFILQAYNPGAVTAIFLNIPFTLYLFHRAMEERVLAGRMVVRLALLACLVYPAAAAVIHFGGESLAALL